MNYICEKATGADRTCKFRTGKIILQQEIPPEQVKKLLAEGKTDLLKSFVSKKTNRKFEAFLVIKDGGTAFEFAPRERKTKAKGGTPTAPLPKMDFTGKEPLGKCPKCGGKIFDTESGYLCEKSQADAKPCRFKINRKFCSSRLSRRRRKNCWPRTRPICSTNSSPRPGKRFRPIS